MEVYFVYTNYYSYQSQLGNDRHVINSQYIRGTSLMFGTFVLVSCDICTFMKAVFGSLTYMCKG